METRAIFGDFQTPTALADRVCSAIHLEAQSFDWIIEPTCGRGAFLEAASARWPAARLSGYEINKIHLEAARSRMSALLSSGRLQLAEQDFFRCDWRTKLAQHEGSVLILGNPPWVTNSALSAAGAKNLPDKNNFQRRTGLDAITGKANFDIAEWMLIRLIEALQGRRAKIAMLCKTATARKVLLHAWKTGLLVSLPKLHRIDASRHFGVSVDACLLDLETGVDALKEARLLPALGEGGESVRFGIRGRDLVADLDRYEALAHLEGNSPFVWRSGVKHDCSAVMELSVAADGTLRNGLEETVEIEPDLLYPLFKSTDVSKGSRLVRKRVLVPQTRIGEDTHKIARDAPRTWRYLSSHATRLDARRSSIYAGQPPFSIFGVGEYSFAPWKVAVSALHRTCTFTVVGPYQGQPAMLDDTCYFLPFEQESQARAACAILNSDACARFIRCLTFEDSKRYVTRDLLQRIDLRAVADVQNMSEEWHALNRSGVSYSGTSDRKQLSLVMEPVRSVIADP